MSEVVDVDSKHEGFLTSRTWLFGMMLLSACLSLIASFVLSWDAVKLAADPNAALSCDISSVISCGKVGLTWQASLLGFPNAFFGLICEPVVMTVAVLGLSGHFQFPKWFMATAQAVYLCGLIFALWLFSQSAFVIHAFCPWCLLVTLCTTVTFFTMLRYNLLEGYVLPKKWRNSGISAVRSGYDTLVLVLILAVLVVIIAVKYGHLLFA